MQNLSLNKTNITETTETKISNEESTLGEFTYSEQDINEDNYEAELELVNGKQPVYSFIVGVE